MTTILFFSVLAGLLAVSPKFAVDSRPGFDERPEGDRFGVLR